MINGNVADADNISVLTRKDDSTKCKESNPKNQDNEKPSDEPSSAILNDTCESTGLFL